MSAEYLASIEQNEADEEITIIDELEILYQIDAYVSEGEVN